MEPILYLVHRIPFPPNKGDKIRSYHLLRWLAKRHRVHLGTFVDDAADLAHVPQLDALTATRHVARLHPRLARLRSLSGLASGEALTLPFYRDRGLAAWVRDTVAAHGIRKVVIFSSPMAQYVVDLPGVQVVADFCDVDSAKWTEYAAKRSWPASWIFRREGERLLAFERDVAARVAATTFVTAAEAELFAGLAPETRARVSWFENGVDTAYFAPDAALVSPYPADVAPIVFTGAMDYWPNVDAVEWFADDVLPGVAARRPDARFYIVGMNPAPKVRALASRPNIVVTGKVPDVRPYLQHARVVVAPLRLARGVQNKVLEAMAMARPVVASATCTGGLSAAARGALRIAEDAPDFERAVLDLIGGAGDLGDRARRAVVDGYSWDAHLARVGALLDGKVAHDGARAAPAIAAADTMTAVRA